MLTSPPGNMLTEAPGPAQILPNAAIICRDSAYGDLICRRLPLPGLRDEPRRVAFGKHPDVFRRTSSFVIAPGKSSMPFERCN